jgi:hypothetical protein
MTAALGSSEAFVAEPGIRPQRMEREIFRPLLEFDLVDMDGLAAMPGQDFLNYGFLLR